MRKYLFIMLNNRFIKLFIAKDGFSTINNSSSIDLDDYCKTPLVNCIGECYENTEGASICGSINTHSLKTYNHPFMCGHIMFNSISQKRPDSSSDLNYNDCIFTFDVSIYNRDYTKHIDHTFTIISYIEKFLTGVIPYLNDYIEDGLDIDNINFSWLDNSCKLIHLNFGQTFSLVDCCIESSSLEGAYKILGNLNVSGFRCGERSANARIDDEEWDEIRLTLEVKSGLNRNQRDLYIEKFLTDFMGSEWELKIEDRGIDVVYIYSYSYITNKERVYSVSGLGEFSGSRCMQIASDLVMRMRISLINTYSEKSFVYAFMQKNNYHYDEAQKKYLSETMNNTSNYF
ncbi:MAG: hypothetical protein J6B97_08605 [Bacteroidales bacterium]|nr:hypothetical protein [Bacteroidales bacterium]